MSNLLATNSNKVLQFSDIITQSNTSTSLWKKVNPRQKCPFSRKKKLASNELQIFSIFPNDTVESLDMLKR